MQIFFSRIKKEKHRELFERNWHRFPSDFQMKLQQFRPWQDAQTSLLGRLLLEKGLAECYQKKLDFAEISYGKQGKPYLKNSEISFNISHSGELVACVLAKEQSLAIDLERIKAIQFADLKSQMTKSEWSFIQESEDSLLAFYDYWTSKEAVLKATGKGISLGLKTFEIDFEKLQTYADAKIWYLKKCFLTPEYCCYIASEQKIISEPGVHLYEF